MAANQNQVRGRYIFLTVGSGVKSGDPVAVGQIGGVAQYDADSNNQATIDRSGVYNLKAHAFDGTSNAAIAVGDILYYDSADGVAKLNKHTAAVRFGYALDALASGSNGTIRVAVGYD